MFFEAINEINRLNIFGNYFHIDFLLHLDIEFETWRENLK